MSTFLLPDLGEGLQEAEILAWHVGVGDHVVSGQPLVSVETDKAVVDVPSPQAGVVVRLFAEPGTVVAVGEPLVEFDGAERADAGTVVGAIEREPARVLTADTGAVHRSTARATQRGPRYATIRAVPAVRALARRLGVDLARVEASGPAGSVTRSDVERAASAATLAPGYEPLRGVRRAMAERMASAHAEVAIATVTDDADVDSWWPAGGQPQSPPMTRLIRSVVVACQVEPALNASYDGAHAARRMNERVDLGIAVDTEDGLFAPVLRDAGAIERSSLESAVDDLRRRVGSRTIEPEALRGQTITLSNFGTIAGRHAALIVVPPQVAIVGAGRVGPRAIARAGGVAVRNVLPLSLSFDHRAVTGGEAARFLAALIADLQQAG